MAKYFVDLRQNEYDCVIFKKDDTDYFNRLHCSIVSNIIGYLDQCDIAALKSTCKYHNKVIYTSDIVEKFVDDYDLLSKVIYKNKLNILIDLLDQQRFESTLLKKALIYSICTHRNYIAQSLLKYVDISSEYKTQSKGCYIDNCAVCGHYECFRSYLNDTYNIVDNVYYDLQISPSILYAACLYSCNWKFLSLLNLQYSSIFTNEDVNIILYSPFLNSYDEQKTLSFIFSKNSIKMNKSVINNMLFKIFDNEPYIMDIFKHLLEQNNILNRKMVKKSIFRILCDNQVHKHATTIKILLSILDQYSVSLSWLYRKLLTYQHNGCECYLRMVHGYLALSILLDVSDKITVKKSDLDLLISTVKNYDKVYYQIKNKIVLGKRRCG